MTVEAAAPRSLLRRLYDWCIEAAHKPHAMWTMGAIAFAESSFFPVPPDIMLIPMSLAILVVTAVMVYYTDGRTFSNVDGETAVNFFAANLVLLIVMLITAKLLTAAPDTNRRITVAGSRFARTPLPANG